MRILGAKAGLVAGSAVILIVNAALLSGAAWNRGGEPESELALTERELTLIADAQEEHGGVMLAFRLGSQTPDVLRRAARVRRHDLEPHVHPWLDRDKLRELGFAVDLDPADPEADEYYLWKRMRRAYLVLEFEGPAWDGWLDDRERRLELLRVAVEDGTAEAQELADAEGRLAYDRVVRSRLFPVDAGTDAEALRGRYPDRRRYAVVEGLVRPSLIRNEDDEPVLTGSVEGPIPARVNVPLKLRRPLEPLLPDLTWRERESRERAEAKEGWPAPVPPRYRARVAFGRRHDAWLVEVEPLQPGNPD